MKAKSAGNRIQGFSTLELVIALALLIVVIVGGLHANVAAQYWSMASETSNEALYKAKTLIETARAVSGANFQSVSSTPLTRAENPDDPADAACIAGGMCYFTRSTVFDISSCSKYVEAYVEWSLGGRYPTSTATLYTNLTDNEEIIALGGDCILNEPSGAWQSDTPETVGDVTLSPSNTMGMDVLQKRIYLVSASAPQFRVFKTPNVVGQNPSLLGSTSGMGFRLNGVDAVRDLSTGRTYAFVTQHASTSQLAVIDVTDASAPSLISKRTLTGVEQTGSYPEGWRVFAYSGRLYVTTRETTGPELHIFNINNPTQPAEVVSATTELNRTVNDLVVREEEVGGSVHRYLFMVADANTKELAVYDVTGDAPVERNSVDLPGDADALTLFLTGNTLYLGRASSGGEPELYVFDVQQFIGGNDNPLASSEVGSSVTTIRGTGSILMVGTTNTGNEFQVWSTDTGLWNASVPNTARLTSYTFDRLAPLGVELNTNWVYLMSQSSVSSEVLKIIHVP